MAKITKIEAPVPVQIERKRVAAYARVSKDTESMLHSFSAQVSYYNELIQSNPEWEYAGVYADEGISGTGTAKRVEFKRMIADCEAGKIDLILVKSISRFARNTLDLLKTVRHLQSLGVAVWFEEQRINSLSKDGELLLTLLASFAQAESESISENAKWAIRKAFEQGIGNTRHRTFGYRWVKGELVVVPEEAEIVREIYEAFLEGKSRMCTTRELNEKGIRSVKGNPISMTAVCFILKNVTYTGNTLLQKTFISDPFQKKKQYNKGELPQYFVENDHEAIIDLQTYEAVQDKLAENRRLGLFPYNRTGEKYPFAKMITCGCCGRHYKRNLWDTKGKQKFPAWSCVAKNGSYVERCLESKNIPEKKLYEAANAVLGMGQFDSDYFYRWVDQIRVNGKNELIFELKDGREISYYWEHTAQRESWTTERKARHAAYRTEHPANTPGTTIMTAKVRCELCGKNYNRQTRRVAQLGMVTFWKCRSKHKCRAEQITYDHLMKIIAQALRVDQCDETIFQDTIDYIGMGEPGNLTIYMQHGDPIPVSYYLFSHEVRKYPYKARERRKKGES